MDAHIVLGIAASACTAFSLLPQLIKIIREKNARNVSNTMMAVLMIGLGLWVSYGIVNKDWIIIISNAISLVITTITILISLKYKKRE